MPAQLSWIVFPAIKPPLVLATYMPHAPPEMLLPTTLASLLARSGPKMTMPDLPERLMSLERILVPVDSTIPVASTVLSVMSLETILVPVASAINTPNQLPTRSFSSMVVLVTPSCTSIAFVSSGMFLTVFFAIVVLELISTLMPSLLSGLPMTSLFSIVVLMLLEVRPIPAALPMARFPATVASRAWRTSIANAVKSPCSRSWKSRIVKPETLTSLTRGPVISPVWKFMSPKMQMASGAQGESALAGGLITASSPRSLMPSLRIATSSWCTPRTTIVSPGSAAFMAFWMDSPGPTTELSALAESAPAARASPLATNRVRAMVANNTMVRLIKRPPLCSRGAKEERCQTLAPLRNEGSILLYEERVCAPAQYVLQSTKVASELLRILLPRRSCIRLLLRPRGKRFLHKRAGAP